MVGGIPLFLRMTPIGDSNAFLVSIQVISVKRKYLTQSLGVALLLTGSMLRAEVDSLPWHGPGPEWNAPIPVYDISDPSGRREENPASASAERNIIQSRMDEPQTLSESEASGVIKASSNQPTNALQELLTDNYPIGLIILVLIGWAVWGNRRCGHRVQAVPKLAANHSQTGVARYIQVLGNQNEPVSGETGVAKYLKTLEKPSISA
jgi:hypothetical protein